MQLSQHIGISLGASILSAFLSSCATAVFTVCLMRNTKCCRSHKQATKQLDNHQPQDEQDGVYEIIQGEVNKKFEDIYEVVDQPTSLYSATPC